MDGYKHKADTGDIKTVNILGVNIAALDMNRLMRFTCDNIKALSGDYICVSNVHTTVMSYEDEAYRNIQNGAVLAIPDGGPLSSVGRKRGYEISRTTGPGFMEEVLKISAAHGYSHYFYGSTGDTLDKLRATLEEKYPGLNIAGMYSPPFRPLSAEEDAAIVNKINSLSPDFIWVGLGAPKQEMWMAEHQGKVSGLMTGVGAAFDFFAGNIKRAPLWMQKANLEWLYRLMQDPGRLFKRYLVTNTKFIINAVILGR